MSFYQEKQKRKLDRYTELAQKHKNEASVNYEQSKKISETIPFGQPILVGHHSEAKHRKDINKIHNAMNKSIESEKKAEYYKTKINNISNPNIISSDDPEAIKKLEAKLKELLNTKEKIKASKNKHPAYILSNLSGNIRSVKKRIEILEKRQNIQNQEITIGEITLKVNKEENRVKLFFPGKPNENKRKELKQNGFKWSPYNGCWQRQISEYAIQLAKELMDNE